MIKAILAIVVAAFLVGCAAVPRPAPLAQADVISMTKVGMSDEDIVRRIDESRTVFKLGSEDVIRLRNEGVTDGVVNHMLDTYTRAAVEQERRRHYYDYSFYYRYGFYYGHPYYRYYHPYRHWWWW